MLKLYSGQRGSLSFYTSRFDDWEHDRRERSAHPSRSIARAANEPDESVRGAAA